MLQIDLEAHCIDFIQSRSAKERKRIIFTIYQVADNPHHRRRKKLKGKLVGYSAINAGEYVIIYHVTDNDTILSVVMIDKYNDDLVYRRLERKL